MLLIVILRAIVKILDKLTEKEIMKVNIPTGVPLVYELNNDNNVINKKYLINEEDLKIKQDLVARQGKVQMNLDFKDLKVLLVGDFMVDQIFLLFNKNVSRSTSTSFES